MPHERRVFVDARRKGQHGIARFGHEVLTRMRTPARSLSGPKDALSPLDVVNRHRLGLRSTDVVFSPGFHAGPTRARQLLTLHDLIQLQDSEERNGKKTLYYRHVVRPAVLRAGRVLTVSETSKHALEQWLDGAVPVIDVGNGCSDVFFATAPAEQRSGLLYVGACKPHKNPGIAFAALAATPGARMTVVTSDTGQAHRLTAQHGVESRVTVRTGVPDADLAALYASSSALVIPSLSEGFGLPAAEALAARCPVIHWTGCSAVAEIVGTDGLAIADAENTARWADAMAAAEAGELLANDSARIRDRYSWSSVAGRVDEQMASFWP